MFPLHCTILPGFFISIWHAALEQQVRIWLHHKCSRKLTRAQAGESALSPLRGYQQIRRPVYSSEGLDVRPWFIGNKWPLITYSAPFWPQRVSFPPKKGSLILTLFWLSRYTSISSDIIGEKKNIVISMLTPCYHWSGAIRRNQRHNYNCTIILSSSSYWWLPIT